MLSYLAQNLAGCRFIVGYWTVLDKQLQVFIINCFKVLETKTPERVGKINKVLNKLKAGCKSDERFKG